MFLQAWIACHAKPSVSKSTEVLCRVEREAADVTKAADVLAFVCASVCLGAVLDDLEVICGGELENRLQGGRLTVKVNGENAAGAIRSCRLQLRVVQK